MLFFPFFSSVVASSAQTYIVSCLDNFWGSHMALAPAWAFGFTPHTAGWLAFLRLPQTRQLPCSETFNASLFPRKWTRKTYGPSYPHRLKCHNSFTYGLHRLTRAYFSLRLPFLLGLEWYVASLCLPDLFLPQWFPWSPKHLKLLSPLTLQRLCTSHPQLNHHFSG